MLTSMTTYNIIAYTDSLSTRYNLITGFCVYGNKPWIYLSFVLRLSVVGGGGLLWNTAQGVQLEPCSTVVHCLVPCSTAVHSLQKQLFISTYIHSAKLLIGATPLDIPSFFCNVHRQVSCEDRVSSLIMALVRRNT
jgi:hypothetical protein